MSYDKDEDKSGPSDRFGHHEGSHRGFEHGNYERGKYGREGFSGGDWLNWARRPGFHPLKAVATVGAFAIFPPLGVLTLGYFLFTSWRGWGLGPQSFAGGPAFEGRGRCGGGRGRMNRWSSGNEAFDEHQREAVEKIREDRRAFHEYRAGERRKRDTEAYEAFRAAEASKPADEDKKD